MGNSLQKNDEKKVKNYQQICKNNDNELKKLYKEIQFIEEERRKLIGIKSDIKFDNTNIIANLDNEIKRYDNSDISLNKDKDIKIYDNEDIISDIDNEIKNNNTKNNSYKDNTIKCYHNPLIISLIEKEIKVYYNIFKYDNTKEKDNLQYLLLHYILYKLKKIDEREMKNKLDLFQIFISDDNYDKYFSKFHQRENSLTKIFNLIELLKNKNVFTKENENDGEKNIKLRKNFISDILNLDLKEKKNIKFKKSINWDNIELYLYNLYMMFLTSLIQQINNHKISMNSSVINSEEYHKLFEEYILAENEKEKEEKLNELQLLKVYKGEFMNIYMAQLNIILNDVNENFTARFRKNKFKSEDDKCIFEDYIQFLSSCKFDSKSLCLSDIINFWKETFIQMKNEEKIQLVEYYNNLEKESKKNFKLENDNNTLIVKYYEKKNRIDNINNYCFSCLPSRLITNILRSKAVKEAIDTLFECSYINILDDPSFLSQTLDNVKFFIYKTSSYASTNENSLRVYEYGLFNFEEKISESLLSFYSFNIVSNLHEICGHFNIRVQNFNSLNNSFDSPTIEDNSNLYSDYAKLRKKESGETLEIKLFGRKTNNKRSFIYFRAY